MAVNAIRQDEEQKEVLRKDVLIRLYKYLFHFKKELLLVAVIMLVTLVINMISPLIMEAAINVYVAAGDIPGLLRLGMFAILLFLIFTLGTQARMLIVSKLSNEVLLMIREDLYTHIQTLSFHFFDTRPTGKILARLIGDVNSLKELLSDSVTKLLPDLLTVVGVAVIMLVKNVYLSMAALLTLPILVGGMFFIKIKAHKLWQIFRKKIQI